MKTASANHGENVQFHGSVPTEDEDLTPTLESDIVLDWLDSLGGIKLVEHTFRVFAKGLEKETLGDLRQRISDNLTSLISCLKLTSKLSSTEPLTRTDITPLAQPTSPN